MDNDFNWAGDDFNQLNEESAELPEHDFIMPHFFALGGAIVECPPNCPRRLALEGVCVFCRGEGDCVECDPETGWK
jgi:hypothetical protein